MGGFSIEQAGTLPDLEARGCEAARAMLLSPESLVASLERITLAPDGATAFRHGQMPPLEASGPPGAEMAVYDPGGSFLGVGRRAEGGRLAPLRLMAQPAEIP